jgi:hypothetical protein
MVPKIIQEEKRDYLDVMINICPHCPYNKGYRIGIKCTKFKTYPYYLDECPNIKSVLEEIKNAKNIR